MEDVDRILGLNETPEIKKETKLQRRSDSYTEVIKKVNRLQEQ